MKAYEDPHDARSAALLYTALGLHVLPINAVRVPVIPAWQELQRRPASKEEIYGWYEVDPHRGVGIIGANHLTIIDLDDLAFSHWVEVYVAPRLATWVVRTGSGKLHLYFFSAAPNPTTVISAGGIKVADVRAGGVVGTAYVAAPPSLYFKDGVRGSYQTIQGGPDQILHLPDAIAIWRQLVPEYEAITVPFSVNGHVPEPKTSSREWDPPLTGAALDTLLQRIAGSDVDGTRQRDIFEANDHKGTHSDQDFRTISTLVEHGFDNVEIEAIFATFLCGERCYRNRTRPNHGHSYMQITVANARKKFSQRIDIEAEGGVAGKNFVIRHCTRLEFDVPLYELDVLELDEDTHDEASPVRKAIANVDDIYSPTRLQKRVTDALGIVPIFKDAHLGASGYQHFATALLRMAEREEVPLSATTSGHLHSYILTVLRQQNQVISVEQQPTTERGFVLGYRPLGSEWVFLRSGALIRQVMNSIKPPPPPEKVWGELRKMGGAETDVTYAETKTRETLWTLPARMLE